MNREKLKEHLIGLAHSCNCTLGQMIFVSTGMVMLLALLSRAHHFTSPRWLPAVRLRGYTARISVAKQKKGPATWRGLLIFAGSPEPPRLLSRPLGGGPKHWQV